jgi:hypothetical protein
VFLAILALFRGINNAVFNFVYDDMRKLQGAIRDTTAMAAGVEKSRGALPNK